MPTEIEAKFRLDDPEAMRKALLTAGARPAGGKILEHNTYFDRPDGSLRRSDRGLRVRVEDSPDGQSRTVMTCKGPRRPGELKVRQEEELTVEAPADAAGFLGALGYEPAVAFQKRRENYRLGAAVVSLDELPELGFFLEIEGHDEETVQRARRTLGLERAPTLTTPYVALVAEHIAGLESKELSF